VVPEDDDEDFFLTQLTTSRSRTQNTSIGDIFSASSSSSVPYLVPSNTAATFTGLSQGGASEGTSADAAALDLSDDVDDEAAADDDDASADV
jgi:hypothetical protein